MAAAPASNSGAGGAAWAAFGVETEENDVDPGLAAAAERRLGWGACRGSHGAVAVRAAAPGASTAPDTTTWPAMALTRTAAVQPRPAGALPDLLSS